MVLLAPAYAYVLIDINRLEAEMKYWLCSADGETADVLLHVMAEATIKESQSSSAAISCATFPAAVAAVDSALAGRAWLPPAAAAAGTALNSKPPSWAGCSSTSCPVSGNNKHNAAAAAAAVPLKLEIPTYVRLLEFGHEQAKDCKDAHAAIETFVKGLVAAGCADRACASSDYLAARPPSGCKALEV
uniref:Uncharacterized protein n=1 Tax=Tetradesmus obliquus TaxID=3088 RepID=A0A383VDA5_TETOB